MFFAMSRPSSKRNITRHDPLDSGGGGGWQVRMRRKGKSFDRFFADAAYGGKRGALQAAKEYREAIDEQHEHYTTVELSKNASIRNTSGIVGVRRVEQIDERGDYQYTYYYWVAQWIDGHGKRKTRSFSVSRYGEKRAYKMAMDARKEGVAKANR